MPTLPKQDLSSRFDELPDLLPFPAVALKLMQACKDPKNGARELCQIIECDASLSTDLLRISNSSLYGCAGQIKTVEHAAVVLGVSGLRDLALSAAAADVFAAGEEQHPASQALWQHSLGCATVARILAEHVEDVSPDEAFVAGLVHDVGKLIFIEILKDDYDLMSKSMLGICIVEDEAECFGVSHTQLGQRCGEEWGLPLGISDAIGFHHAPRDADAVELASVVSAANQLSKIWRIGAEDDVEISEAEILEENELGFDEAVLADMIERAPVDFAASKQVFGA